MELHILKLYLSEIADISKYLFQPWNIFPNRICPEGCLANLTQTIVICDNFVSDAVSSARLLKRGMSFPYK